MTTRSVTSCTGDAEVSEEASDRVVAQVAELSALFGVPPKKVVSPVRTDVVAVPVG